MLTGCLDRAASAVSFAWRFSVDDKSICAAPCGYRTMRIAGALFNGSVKLHRANLVSHLRAAQLVSRRNRRAMSRGSRDWFTALIAQMAWAPVRYTSAT